MEPDKIHTDIVSLSRVLTARRRRGERIVFANGCFELLHVGHIEYLQGAKALGDILIVAVNTDASIAINKPGRKPTVPEMDRMRIIAAIGAVDYVVPLADRTPIQLIERFKPHIHTKGLDYQIDLLPEKGVVERNGGRVVLVGGPKEKLVSVQISRK